MLAEAVDQQQTRVGLRCVVHPHRDVADVEVKHVASGLQVEG